MARKNCLETIANLIKNEQLECKNQVNLAVQRYDYQEALKNQTVFNALNRILMIIDACKPKGKAYGTENQRVD